MARGANKSRLKRFYVSIKTKTGIPPTLEIRRKESDKYVLLDNETRDVKDPSYIMYNDTNIAGQLTSIKLGGYDWKEKNKYIETVTIVLSDEQIGEEYVLNCTYSNINRALFNSLLNIDIFGDIDISVYRNKDGYSAVSVKNNEDWAGFKYPYDDYKGLIREFEGKNGLEKDYSKVDMWFKKKLEEELIPKVKTQLNARPKKKKDPNDINPNDRDLASMLPEDDQAPIEDEVKPNSKQNDLPF